jgi:hypothetical protein
LCALQGEAILGKRFSVVAEYVLKVLGLDYVAGGSVCWELLLAAEGGATDFPASHPRCC